MIDDDDENMDRHDPEYMCGRDVEREVERHFDITKQHLRYESDEDPTPASSKRDLITVAFSLRRLLEFAMSRIDELERRLDEFQYGDDD